MFNFWKKNKKTQCSSNKNAITIVIHDDGKFDVEIIYDQDNPKTPENFGKLFYCLNRGLLMTYFIEQINTIIMNDPKNSYTMLSILKYWNQFYDISDSKKPLINPSTAFNKNAKY